MNKFRYLLKPGVLLSGLGVAFALALSFNMISQPAAQAASDCDNNAIIKCGFSGLGSSGNGFVAKYNQNQGGNVKALYDNRGLQTNEISRFASTAKKATVYKDGRVVLEDGTVVATNAASSGRQRIGSNRHEMKVGDSTFYWSYTKDSFAAGSIPAYVMLNPTDNSMEFAVLTACGNPVWGTTSGYYCKELKKEKVNDTTYNFSTTTYQKNASLVKLVYECGDGQTKTITSNFGQKVTCTYAKPGNYTAKVTAHFNVNGKIKTHTRAECTTPVEIPQPPKPVFACKNLTMVVKNKDEREYEFTVTADYANGPVLASADFDFGDGQKQNVKANADKKTATTTHKYSKTLEGDVTIKATVISDKGEKKTAASCEQKINFAKQPKPVFACKNLVIATVNKDEREYSFTVASTQADGPELKTADFDFGDGQTQKGVVANADKQTAKTTHKYAKTLEGDVTIKATVYATTGQTASGAACQVVLNFEKQPPKECKPGIPEGDERCSEYCKPGIPVGDERCKEYCKPNVEVGSKECEEVPAELPSTGPTEIIASMVGMGGVAAAATYYRNSRRNLLSSIFKR